MTKHPRTVDYKKVARELGVTIKQVRDAFGETDAKWFQEVLDAGSIKELWHLFEFIGRENPDKQVRILRRILYHTRGESRWDVVRAARKKKLTTAVEMALLEILRLSTSKQIFKKVVRHADRNGEAFSAAIRDYALDVPKHRFSQRHRLRRP